MKSRMRLLLGAVTTLVLAMSVGLLTGCGGSSQSNDEPLGAWDNTSLGVSLEFKDDGTVTYYDGFDAIEGTYEWKDETVTIDIPGEGTASGSIDKDGDLLFEGMNSYFISVSAPSYAPGSDSEEEEETATRLDISDTVWEIDGTTYTFYSNGTFLVGDSWEGTYEWNGYDGHVTLDGKDFDITYDGDDFNLRGLDGEWYVLEYSKAA